MNDPPLKDLLVLDLSRVLAGPYCSMTLSDLGAQIIKVEIPKKGDDTRAFPPFINKVSSYFLSVNRGKKSIAVDLKTQEGKEIIYKLVAKSDIFLENFRPGVTTRLAVDYETLRSINPRLIYCSISSFGQTGPYAKWPGYDLIIQGMGGLMGITGERGRLPVRVGMAVTDINAGMYATIAILSALRVRSQTGLGQYLDVSMLDASISLMTYIAGNYFATGKVPDRMGTAHPSIVPYQGFKTGDNKFILIAGANDRLFELFCKTIDQEKLSVDPRYRTNEERVKNRDSLIQHLQRVFMKKPRDKWVKAFRNVGFPCAPVYTIDEIFKDPQVLHRNMLVKMDHPVAGKINQIGPTIKFSESTSILTIPPPNLGQHTEEILKSVGYNDDLILELRKKEVIN
jgi:crotonobetainyl-CoA:carnitine CoA-transferase CaiB-like acyl-CoA transferase